VRPAPRGGGKQRAKGGVVGFIHPKKNGGQSGKTSRLGWNPKQRNQNDLGEIRNGAEEFRAKKRKLGQRSHSRRCIKGWVRRPSSPGRKKKSCQKENESLAARTVSGEAQTTEKEGNKEKKFGQGRENWGKRPVSPGGGGKGGGERQLKEEKPHSEPQKPYFSRDRSAEEFGGAESGDKRGPQKGGKLNQGGKSLKSNLRVGRSRSGEHRKKKGGGGSGEEKGRFDLTRQN